MTGSEPESPTAAMLDGRYRLLECVGRGGMSRVHRAEDTALGRIVAIKLIADMGDEDAARARGEVAVLASLSHPALVTLFDAHIGAGEDYLVMEFVDGPTLSQLLREGPLPSAETAALATEIAEALHAVHRAGIVHRDVKPSNVLLASTDVPGRRFHAKLADFGIAYLLDSDRMTSPGMVMGTAAYLAPEQARGEAPTPATDVYALGLMLLEALTGRPAFPRATPVASAIVRQTTRPEIPASVPPGWASLIERMTAPDPAERPAAADVARETAALANASPGAQDAAATMPLAGLGAAAGAGLPGAAAAGVGLAATAAASDAPTAAIPATEAMPATVAIPGTAATPQTGGLPPAAAAVFPAAAGTGPASATAAPASRRRSRRRPALIATGVAAVAAAIGLGAWALSGIDDETADPSRGVAPVVQTESPETTTPPPQQPTEVPAQAPAPDGGDTGADETDAEQRKAEEEQRKADEKQRKAEEKAAEDQRKAEEKAAKEQREAEEEAEEDAEETEEQPPPTEEPAPPPATVPPATEVPAP